MDRDGVGVDKLAKVAVKVAVDPLVYRLVDPQLLCECFDEIYCQ